MATPLRGWTDYGSGLDQRGFDHAYAATPHLRAASRTLHNPVQFRQVAATDLLVQSQFAMPLGQEAVKGWASGWTLWGRGTASGFDGRSKDNFSMDGNVFTGYPGLDYRLQSNVLLGLAVAHSQGDVDYEARDVTEGAVDITLTSVLPYVHWSPRPGLGVWRLFGAGWGNLKLRDETGKVKTDPEMLMGAVGAREVPTPSRLLTKGDLPSNWCRPSIPPRSHVRGRLSPSPPFDKLRDRTQGAAGPEIGDRLRPGNLNDGRVSS